MFAALQNYNDSEDVKRAWKNIKENIKISAKESRSAQIEATLTMFWKRKFMIFRSKESGRNALITASKPKYCQ